MIGAIVQARMGSTRLPGKVMLEAAGKPMLGHLLERLEAAATVEAIIVATSTDARDDPIVAFCEARGTPVFRGSETDVLDRYYRAAWAFACSVIVRITGDCPLIDPGIVDMLVLDFVAHREEYDLVTNRHPLTFPDGLDLDVFSRRSLAQAWAHARTPHQREHTVPYFWESGMRVHNVTHPDNLFLRHRWTLDYPEDYALIRRLLDALYKEGHVFGMADILAYLAKHPALSALNARYLPAAALIDDEAALASGPRR
ncbi:MAG TPA: glycosyltransferase family protein [Gemmatimonadaceae bacterium]|nr:glycosyltransferase family protein [Gemmatimonadaceae bacterium]